MQNAYAKNLIIGFNAYVNTKEKAITEKNYQHTVELIEKALDKFNKQGAMVGIKIDPSYKDSRLKILKLKLDIKLAKAKEHETMKEEKHRLKEQEKLLKEIEKEKADIQKERRMYEQSLAKALNDQERQDFEKKLKEIDKREADIDYRQNNTRAGYLYVTSTKAMPDCCKIGVTRRLNPLVRIAELSSASVPYPFVCHGLVFSDNAFDLETRVHEYFDDKRVNKTNKHKEFFYVTPQEAIDVLTKEFKCEVHFTESEENDEL